MGVCAEKGCFIGIDEKLLTVSCGNEVIMAGVQQENFIYGMFVRVRLPSEEVEANVSSVDLKVWHERLGHVGARALQDMVKNGLVDEVKLKNTDKFFCESFQFGKAHRLPFRDNSSARETEPGESVHSTCAGQFRQRLRAVRTIM